MKHRPEASEALSLVSGAGSIGVALTPQQVSKLERFERLLVDRAIPAGLVAAADRVRVRSRHVLDCMRAVVAVGDRDRDAYDLGSGAGLPGIVVAIACSNLTVGLVDSRARRAAFLELAVEQLGLENAHVLGVRIEDLTEAVDVCFARALAPIDRAWALSEPVLRSGGRLVYFAGEDAQVPARLAGRTPEVLSTPVLERGGPLVIMAR